MSSSAGRPGVAWVPGARAAGMVVAFGYVLGLVRGPVVAVIGGLALVTFARCVATPPPGDLVLGGSLTVLAGAVGVGALRWGALDLGELRGIQAVLGPTVLVGPVAAAAASWLAAGAAVVALGVWLGTALAGDRTAPRAGAAGRLAAGLWVAEAAAGGGVVTTVFWGPSIPRSASALETATAVAGWAVAAAVVAGAAIAVALWCANRALLWRWAGLGAAGVAVLGAAGMIASEL